MLLVLAYSPTLRNTRGMLLCNIAVADLGVLSEALFALVAVWSGEKPVNETGCDIIGFINFWYVSGVY